jgi:hypothetical protein
MHVALQIYPFPPPSDPGPDPGGGVDFGRLKAQALVALLNPDCANLFGGFKNAATSLLNSSYNMYTAGQANPYPNLIGPGRWTGLVANFQDPTKYGYTFPYTSKPGGVTFFGNSFSNFSPGFASSAGEVTQMTGFFHELEHAAIHDPLHNFWIDSNYAADAETIRSNCTPKQIETESVPITGGLTPP